jgi:hypothetical protein
VLNQGKLMDNLSKKLASNDKVLETINNRMDNFSTILGQSEDLETANLVDIFNAGSYWSDPISKGWNDETANRER